MTPTPNANELLAVVNEQDQTIGAEKRSIIRQQGLIYRLSKVIITNSNNEILIQQRSGKMADSPLKWDSSAAGHVDAGESYEAAARREAKEEIGLKLKDVTFLGTYYCERHKPEATLRRFVGCFISQSDDQPVLDPVEVAQVRWIAQADLKTWMAQHPNDFTRSFIELAEKFSIFTRSNR